MAVTFLSPSVKGISDTITYSPAAVFTAIEVKQPKGRVSQEQAEFIERVNRNNGVAFVARSLDDVLAQI
jgi:hypothetical protein